MWANSLRSVVHWVSHWGRVLEMRSPTSTLITGVPVLPAMRKPARSLVPSSFEVWPWCGAQGSSPPGQALAAASQAVRAVPWVVARAMPCSTWRAWAALGWGVNVACTVRFWPASSCAATTRWACAALGAPLAAALRCKRALATPTGEASASPVPNSSASRLTKSAPLQLRQRWALGLLAQAWSASRLSLAVWGVTLPASCSMRPV